MFRARFREKIRYKLQNCKSKEKYNNQSTDFYLLVTTVTSYTVRKMLMLLHNTCWVDSDCTVRLFTYTVRKQIQKSRYSIEINKNNIFLEKQGFLRRSSLNKGLSDRCESNMILKTEINSKYTVKSINLKYFNNFIPAASSVVDKFCFRNMENVINQIFLSKHS